MLALQSSKTLEYVCYVLHYLCEMGFLFHWLCGITHAVHFMALEMYVSLCRPDSPRIILIFFNTPIFISKFHL